MDVLGAEGGGCLRVEDKVCQGGQEAVQCIWETLSFDIQI